MLLRVLQGRPRMVTYIHSVRGARRSSLASVLFNADRKTMIELRRTRLGFLRVICLTPSRMILIF